MNDARRPVSFRCPLWLFSLLLCFLGSSVASAHSANDAYLTLNVNRGQVTGEWHLGLRDLHDALGLDANHDGQITWNELRQVELAVRSYATDRLHLTDAHGRGAIRITQMLVDRHSDGAYVVLRLAVDGIDLTSEITVCYEAFFDLDASHRGLARIADGGSAQTAVFSPSTTQQRFRLGAAERRFSRGFIKEGVWHIWTGYDHLLFLMVLLLPAALRRRGTEWEPNDAIKQVLGDVLKTASAFTVAHSTTFSLAAAGWVLLNPRWVESAIAASVILAALNNVRQVLPGQAWTTAFCFGFVHGFGFANSLTDLGLHGTALLPALLGFNVGVELGQLAVVAVVLGMLVAIRHRVFYRTRLLPLGSLAVAAAGVSWLLDRALGLRCIPF